MSILGICKNIGLGINYNDVFLLSVNTRSDKMIKIGGIFIVDLGGLDLGFDLGGGTFY